MRWKCIHDGYLDRINRNGSVCEDIVFACLSLYAFYLIFENAIADIELCE